MLKKLNPQFSSEELLEFLEGDLHPLKADPVFKALLREELWELVQRRYVNGSKDSDA